ncbi:hypothetical protein BESB_074680 [Besnoitia besnoiti]|uniref:RAP domain-containing protein n=1 Tax=Besnoitia besnoiti TaxID=94643 RepID=A0A2A9MEE0_BESBE|nr:uncharacterized protein BESB_074680 [Besnoitia besnoiti]PFH34316.1 hypothetical protein BESB_074680 [Besnoitia besnoiti]
MSLPSSFRVYIHPTRRLPALLHSRLSSAFSSLSSPAAKSQLKESSARACSPLSPTRSSSSKRRVEAASPSFSSLKASYAPRSAFPRVSAHTEGNPQRRDSGCISSAHSSFPLPPSLPSRVLRQYSDSAPVCFFPLSYSAGVSKGFVASAGRSQPSSVAGMSPPVCSRLVSPLRSSPFACRTFASVASLAACEALHSQTQSGVLPSTSAFSAAVEGLKQDFPFLLASPSADASSLSTPASQQALSASIYHLLMALNRTLPLASVVTTSPSPPSASPASQAAADACFALFLPFVVPKKDKRTPAFLLCSSPLLSCLSGPATVSLFLFFALSSALSRQSLAATPSAAPCGASSAVGALSKEDLTCSLSLFGSLLSLRERDLSNEDLLLIRIGLEALGIRGKRHPLLLALRDGGRSGEELAADFFALLPLHPGVTEETVWGAREGLAQGEGEAQEARGEEAAEADSDQDDNQFDEDEEAGDASSHKTQGGTRVKGEDLRSLSPLEREVSSLLFRLEKPHEVLPTTLGPFVYTLRNAKKKELFLCQHERDFYKNESTRLVAHEQWRYLLAQLRGWKLTVVARECTWSLLSSQQAKEKALTEALRKSV